MVTLPDDIFGPEAIDYDALDREMDRVKASVFVSNNAAFLAPLMCSMEFSWDESIPTAATNGVWVKCNPHFFAKLPFETKKFLILHEIWHPAYLHMLRRGDRDPMLWNYAADTKINNNLHKDGYTWDGLPFKIWFDMSLDDKTEEEIYEIYLDRYPPDHNQQPQQQTLEEIDYSNPGTMTQVVNNVLQARHQANVSKQAGQVPGATSEWLDNFLKPKVPWNKIVRRFMNDLIQQDTTWARPNRRYPDLYLPSPDKKPRLQHLSWYLDTSGSITEEMEKQFISEVRYMKKTYNPVKMSIIQFDTIIQDELVLMEHDNFDGITIKGGGGTCLVPVREHMLRTKPSAAVVFSDLYVGKMETIPKLPVVWICIDNPDAQVNFGKLVHVKV